MSVAEHLIPIGLAVIVVAAAAAIFAVEVGDSVWPVVAAMAAMVVGLLLTLGAVLALAGGAS